MTDNKDGEFFILIRGGLVEIKRPPDGKSYEFFKELSGYFPDATIVKVALRDGVPSWAEHGKDFAFRHEAYAQMAKDQEETNAHNRALLMDLQHRFGVPFYEGCLDCISESEANDFCKFKIAEKPRGECQDEDYGPIKQIWVNQTVNGGMTGDSFSGEVYIPLPEYEGRKEFLEFSYNM